VVIELEWEDLLAGAPVPIQFRGVAPWLLPDARGGTGILLRTNMGSIRCLFHKAEEATSAVIWVAGARGGYNGGGGLYPILSDELTEEGISSLRLSYRRPNDFLHCMLDVVAGVNFLQERGYQRVALVGHSFGGAVVVAAAPMCDAVATVVGLASQTHGAQYVSLVSPRPLLLIHGEDDTRLAPHCSQQIFEAALEPKELVLYPGTGHNLRECRDQLHPLLKTWLVDKLRGDRGGARRTEGR
jgi:pimeloyl-ACP methyl ester carboxylesterase